MPRLVSVDPFGADPRASLQAGRRHHESTTGPPHLPKKSRCDHPKVSKRESNESASRSDMGLSLRRAPSIFSLVGGNTAMKPESILEAFTPTVLSFDSLMGSSGGALRRDRATLLKRVRPEEAGADAPCAP